MEIAVTNGITVAVETNYLPNHSDTRASSYVFGYHIMIENGSPHTVQLLRRHWYITDGAAQLREVEGEGVVGEYWLQVSATNTLHFVISTLSWVKCAATI